MRIASAAKLAIVGAALCSSTVVAKSTNNEFKGFNFTHIGVQTLTYKETLQDFATMGDLESEFEVTNTVLSALSYTHLFDNYGLLLTTQSNVSNEIAADNWTISGFGSVQTNDSKISPSDLQTTAVIHFEHGNYLLLGGQLKTLNFTRSNIEMGEGAADLNEAIRVSDAYFDKTFKPQIVNFKGAIQEDLIFFNAVVGIGHHSQFKNQNSPMYWYANTTISTPLYYVAQNTSLTEQFGIDSITGAFSGYEFQANAGLGIEMVENIFLSFGLNYSMAAYDEINKEVTINGETATAAIPNVDLSGYQVTLGITFIN